MQKNFSLTVAGRSFGKCIDRISLVLTDEGFKEIHQVKVGERIWANRSPQTVLAKVENPKEPGFTVTTNRGYICTGKVGHKVWVFDSSSLEFTWQNIETLKGNEIIPIRRGMDHWGNETPIANYFQPDRGTKPGHPSHPMVLDEDLNLYYVMGVILGDGTMRQQGGTVGVSSMDQEVVDSVYTMIRDHLPNTKVSVKVKDSAAKDYMFCSVRFKAFLRYMGFDSELAYQKTVPAKILSVSKPKVSAFLRGLFDTDGSCTLNPKTNRCEIELGSSSRDIIDKVHSILLNYGILASVTQKHVAGTHRFSNGKDYQTHNAWAIDIFDRRSLEIFSREIGFGIKRKQAKLDLYLSKPTNSAYKHNMLRVGPYFRAKYGQAFRRAYDLRILDWISTARLAEFLDCPFVDETDKAKIRAILDSQCYFDSIRVISPTETETIDIQVDKEECYWSGGFVNHNSTVFSHFCYLYCLLNPGHHILICAATFRSSRQIVERIDEWANPKTKGALLRQTFERDMIKRQDLIKIVFKNGSSITAVPLGDPDNLRGFRCNLLGIDEGLLISHHTINMVLKPFLAGGADPTKKQLLRRREARLIEAGKMQEKDKTVFKADSKMIVLSSASYKWEELYSMYKQYRAIIEKSDIEGAAKAEETDAGAATYLVHQLSYKVGNPDLMDAGILQEIREKRIPESVIKREYEAQFIDESGGFFSAKEIHECSVAPGQLPCIEVTGEKGAEYILAIDPSMSSDPAGDHFAMCVMKVVARARDGRKVGMVVHQYACAGVGLKHHMAYLMFILTHFNIVYLICDTSHGDQGDFISACNESEVFKQAKLELNAIDADFAGADFETIVGQVAKSYNRDSSVKRIVQKQYFSTSIIKAGNDYLRACLNERAIIFASHAASVGKTAELAGYDIGSIHQTHPAFHDEDVEGMGNAYEFVNHQDVLMEQTKKECALIEVSSTALGHISFDLPSHMTKNRKNVQRNRRDSYSALWLANWALKIYLASQELPSPEVDEFIPVMLALR